MPDEKWTTTATQMPPVGDRIDWISPNGDVVKGGQFAGGAVWFLPGDNPMYIYYTPTYWRPTSEAPDA